MIVLHRLFRLDSGSHSFVCSLLPIEGIACGISAGANVWAACQVAKRPEMANKRIVTFLPSAAERYFSTPLYAETMEQAKTIPMADIDESISIEGKLNMNTLASMKEAGLCFREGFHVT